MTSTARRPVGLRTPRRHGVAPLTGRSTADRSPDGHEEVRVLDRPAPGTYSRRPRRWFARHPAWPVTALLAGYPLWWALGLADYMFALLAIPMVAGMYAWKVRQHRSIRLPPGFGLWLLFLVVTLAGVAMLTLTAPDTVNSPVSHRLLSYANRAANYGGVTVLLLYAGNLTERELSRRRLAWLLGLLAVYTAAGGLGGVLAPSFQFSSPALSLLPHSVQANSFIQASMHPGFAQLQDVIGVVQGRPKAPFDYTNAWGNCLSLLLGWLVVGWWVYGTRKQRVITGAVLVAAIVPLVYSLDRGVWIGLGFAACYVAVRMAARGKVALLGAVAAGLTLVGFVFLASPLQQIVGQRLSHGKSNTIRASLSTVAVEDALSSPIIGYGDTRQQRGSPHSIAVGPTANCLQCGQYAVGSNGQLWLLLVCSGFAGAALYFGFFAYAVWRYRRDTTPYGLAGTLALLLPFIYMFTYVAVVAPLGLTMLSYALLWRNDRQSRDRGSAAGPDRTPRPVMTAGAHA